MNFYFYQNTLNSPPFCHNQKELYQNIRCEKPLRYRGIRSERNKRKLNKTKYYQKQNQTFYIEGLERQEQKQKQRLKMFRSKSKKRKAS